jgi:hypothetical protein
MAGRCPVRAGDSTGALFQMPNMAVPSGETRMKVTVRGTREVDDAQGELRIAGDWQQRAVRAVRAKRGDTVGLLPRPY